MKKIIFIICLLTKSSLELFAQVTTATNNNVGIGTSTSSSKLHVYSTVVAEDVTIENTAATGRSGFLLKPGSGNQWTFGATGGSHPLFTNSLYIYNVNGANPGTKFLVNSDGNAGIGNTNPSAKLHIAALANSTQSVITLGNSNDPRNSAVLFKASTGGYNIDFQGYRDSYPNQIGARIRGERINAYADNSPLIQSMDLAFYTSMGLDPAQLTEKARINSSGDLVIGNRASRGKLTIAAPDESVKAAISIRQSNVLYYGFDFGLDQTVGGNMYLRMIQKKKS